MIIFPSATLARLTTFSTVKPNSFNKSSAFADSPKRFDTEDIAFVGDIFVPSLWRGHFNGQSFLQPFWQDLLFIAVILLVEQFPAGHAYDAGRDAVLFELLLRLQD